jgi:hypothetical protein
MLQRGVATFDRLGVVSLLRQRKRETKTRRFAQRLAGKAASQSNTTRRAP